MNRKAALFLVSVFIAGCGAPKQDSLGLKDSTALSADTTLEENSAVNVLSDAQAQEGWKLLFDGKSMVGWRIFRKMENDSWEVANGTLHCKPFNDDGTNKRSDLVTNDQYENFDFKFDWKISTQGNSGVIYLVSEELDQPYATGPEYQILDDEGYPGDVQKEHLTGGVYGIYFPSSERKVSPVGEWNESRLVVNKKHVEHWLNGIKVVEYELDSEDWKKRKSLGKWKDFPKYGVVSKGHIDLQDHGNEVWFRNLKIKTL
jgi:hypothetical protein